MIAYICPAKAKCVLAPIQVKHFIFKFNYVFLFFIVTICTYLSYNCSHQVSIPETLGSPNFDLITVNGSNFWSLYASLYS
jgi:hypothetical protein